MKRASSASKTKSAAPGAKRKPRRRLAVAKKTTPPAKRKPITKSKPVVKREPVAKSKKIAKIRAKVRRKSVAKTKPITKRKPLAKPAALAEVQSAVTTKTLTNSTPAPRPAAKTKSAVRRTPIKKSPVRRPRVKIPAYLLEGDAPAAPAVTGPGEKFALGPETPAAHFAAEAAHLPEAYGTGRLYVTPRDPHWLYAHWDITPQQQFRHNARSVDRHLILRIHEGEVGERPAAEIHVHPESRHWFAHVESTETVYVTELGYYQTGRRWKNLATAAPTKTPADHISTDTTVEFATIPLELSFETMLGLLQEEGQEKIPLARAIEQLRVTRQSTLPPPAEMTEWTPEQEQLLADFLARKPTARSWPSSHEISELLGGQIAGDIPPAPTGGFDLSSFLGGADSSSPFGGGPGGGKDFWFQVNAELIIYGATQPDAKVTVAGKQIALRPDGSFGFRFALPDGQYALPIVAVSADDTDGRAADLKFTRATEFIGEVGEPPQDPKLNPPPQNG
jgi:hypothetical protein